MGRIPTKCFECLNMHELAWVRCGVVWCVVVRCGAMRCGVVWGRAGRGGAGQVCARRGGVCVCVVPRVIMIHVVESMNDWYHVRIFNVDIPWHVSNADPYVRSMCFTNFSTFHINIFSNAAPQNKPMFWWRWHCGPCTMLTYLNVSLVEFYFP